MEQDLDYMANYLAEDLANVNVYDVNLIKAKIKASLRIILDTKKENIVKSKHSDDLKNKVSKLVLTNKIKDIELKFWKASLRSIINEDGMKKYYDEIDSRINQMPENNIYKK